MREATLAIETGGTKIVARLDWGEGGQSLRFPTTTPEKALGTLGAFVERNLPRDCRLTGVGLASFGPLLLEGHAGRRGLMLATSKPGWTGSNLAAGLEERLGCPVAIDTDVNAAALAELVMGAGRALPSLAYVTIGTGIGAGLALRNGTLRGALHPEVGHLRIGRRPDDSFASVCPYHSDCAEGLASGRAITERLSEGTPQDAHRIHALCAGYVADLLVAVVLVWSPHRIVLGGGAGCSAGFLDLVQAEFAMSLGGYGVGDAARDTAFIVPPSLTDAGLSGAQIIAKRLATVPGSTRPRPRRSDP